MLSRVGMVLACLMLSAVAYGAEDDFVMGNYQGSLSGDWAGKEVRAEVITRGDDWQINLFAGEPGQKAERATFTGRERKGSRGDERKDRAAALKQRVVEFDAQIDLGSVIAKACMVKGKITQETLSATLESNGKKGALELKRVFLTPPTLGQKAPEGATVLLAGANLDAWNVQPHWVIDGEGAMHIQGSSIVSKAEFGDALYHVEFMCPFMPDESGQGRGNSGVYLQGRYEVQVLDSYGDAPADNLCGGIYQKATPVVCAALPPLQWQTYDIEFTAPKFDAAGKKTSDAMITVVHNGVTIHDKVVLPSCTPGGVSGDEAAAGPILLQDHGNTVRYRNIWVQTKK